jgi:chromosome segregation ATPase
MLSFGSDHRTRVMRVTRSSGHGPQISAEEAADLQLAWERMIARHKLIEGIIRNNEMQLRNESARGGAEIELECARRDVVRADGGVAAQDEFEKVSERLNALHEEHARLVAEREWLNRALLEFDSTPSDDEHKRTGHA